MTLTVNIDADGVIYDWITPLRGEMVRLARIGKAHFPDPTSWDLDEWGWGNPDDIREAWRRGVMDGRLFRHGDLYPMAKSSIEALIQRNYNVRIVTHKYGFDQEMRLRSRTNFLEFLEQHIPMAAEKAEIIFTDGNKAQYRADVVIDDKPKIEFWAQSGAHNLLFNQPWNQTISANYPFVKRMGDIGDAWPAILAYIDDINGE